MAKIDITRTELVWPGKYDEQGNLVVPERVSLPFQVIERVNQTRATREGEKEQLKGHEGTLFDFWQADREKNSTDNDGWTNKLIWGDNLYVMSSLLERFAGKIDLIYIDPPFATGADFTFSTEIGDKGFDLQKEQSLLEEKAYRDTWGKGNESFISMMYNRLGIMKELLRDTGQIFVHVDYRTSHFIRIILNDIFGENNFLSEIIWALGAGARPSTYFANKFNIIFQFKKGNSWTFNIDDPIMHKPYSESTINMHFTNVDKDGRRYRLQTKNGREYITYEDDGQLIDSIWADIGAQYATSPIMGEYTGFPTQKPEKLLNRIIYAASNKNQVVADFFCGSGTTLSVAEKLGRRWIGCDLSRYAIHTTRKRLMDIENCKPFEILNLGKYERQAWQGVSFGKNQKEQQLTIFEYLKFILELYGAQPLAGTTHLHGKKGSAVVHVGAVDAPVTIDEINACLAECRELKQKELHVLGWEWEMGVANLMVTEAKGQGIKLVLLSIPREVMEKQAVDKGDIHFYELAYLEAEIKVEGKKASVMLKHFNIPNDELIPPEVREKIKKWSDYVDYWAVDWDFQNDTFVNGWTDYRSRQKRELKLKSDAHTYEKAGAYRLMVKVIDIFGNDTSQIFPVEIQ